MRMDTVIMGGGLSGLTCGIALAKRGQRVTIVAGGQSTLMFNGGSMELLGNVDGKDVTAPLEAISTLPQSHPYSKIGAERLADIADEAKQLLADAGIEMEGNADANHWRITPMGIAKPAWLTLSENLRIDDLNSLPAKRVALMCIRGFFDQPNGMLAQGLRTLGFDVQSIEFTTDDITSLRRSPSEMRATSLAKHLVSNNALQRVADQINALAADVDLVVLPSVLGQTDGNDFKTLQGMCNKPLRLVATLPPAVAGMRMHTLLRHYFKMLGGNYLTGDNAIGGSFEGDKLLNVTTAKLDGMPLRANNFVLATGSFVSRGLAANYERVFEPICCLKQGKPITNLHAIGSILSGHDAIKMGDGTGVSLLTALAVARNILCGK